MTKPFSVESLMAQARQLTGIEIDDQEALGPLSVLVASLNDEANLTPAGVIAMRQRLLRQLANRLRMERDWLKHPEIAQQEVCAPVFIFGLPRSGTTKMQKVLSALSEDFTALPLWMALNPSLLSGQRSEPTTPRIEDAENYVQWIKRTNPEAVHVHPFEKFEPEEVNPILEQGFRSIYLPAFVQVPSYINWVIAEPPRRQLEYLKRVLQYLQWQFGLGARPWVLKNPTFLGMEPATMEVFPGAKLVVTHRHPASIIASSASLIVQFHKLYCEFDVHRIGGAAILQGQAAAMNQHLAHREAMAPHIIDVGFTELTQNTPVVVERILARYGKQFSVQQRQIVEAWDKDHAQHSLGVHKYVPEDFGLTREEISRHFLRYIEGFSQYF